MSEYLLNLLTMAALAVIVASSLNLLVGFTGVFSLAQAVFYGVGGYAAALLALHVSDSLLLALAGAGVAGALVAVLLALPAGRVVGEYFAVVSLTFQIVAITVFSQWQAVTGGHSGLYGIPRPQIFGRAIDSSVAYLILAITVAVLVNLVLYMIVRRSPLGRSFQALRDDQLAAEALGKNPFRLRLISVMISAALAAQAGAIYAGYIRFMNAEPFAADASVLFLAMVILGGTRSLFGPIIGALFITLFPAVLGFLELPTQVSGPLQQIFYGLALVILMIVRPGGIMSLGESRSRGGEPPGHAAVGPSGAEQGTVEVRS